MRKLLMSLLALTITLTFPMALSPAQAQDDPQTYVSAGGLVVDYPAGWGIEEFGGQLVIFNAESFFEVEAGDPGNIVAFLTIDLEADLGDVDVENAEAIIDSLSTEADDAGFDLSRETVTLGGVEAVRLTTSIDNIATTIYVFNVEGRNVAMTVQTTADEVSTYDAELGIIISSIRFDAEATGSIDQELSDATATTGTGDVVWFNTFEVGIPNGTPAGLIGVAATPDGMIYVTDSLQLFSIDPQSGAPSFIAGLQEGLPLIILLEAGANGDLYAYSINEGIVRLSTDGSVIASSGTDVLSGSIVSELAVSSTGQVYAFATTFGTDGLQQGEVFVFDENAQFLRSFVVDTFGSDGILGSFVTAGRLAPLPDGTMLLLGLGFANRAIDADGNTVVDSPLPIIEIFEFNFVVNIATTADGTLYYLDSSGLYVIDATGNILVETAMQNEGGTIAENEFTSLSDLAVLPDGRLLVAGNNGEFSFITLYDFSE